MTTDYSAIMQKMVRDLESYLDIDFNNRHWKIVEEAFTAHETELTSAARAEAQHLREQLDRILTAFKALTEASSSWDDWETLDHLLAEIASIDAEDASAQGGEDDET